MTLDISDITVRHSATANMIVVTHIVEYVQPTNVSQVGKVNPAVKVSGSSVLLHVALFSSMRSFYDRFELCATLSLLK